MKKKSVNLMMFIPIIMAVCIVAYVVVNLVFSPYWDSVYAPFGYMSFASMRTLEDDAAVYTNQQACRDIDYVVKMVGRVHPQCADGVPDRVAACAENVKSGFGSEVTAYEIWRGTAQILHELDDPNSIAAPSFPLHYLKDHSAMLDEGAELSAINGVSIDEIFHENSDAVSYDCEEWGISSAAGLAATKEGLKYLGVESTSLTFTYRFSDGSTAEKTYTANDFYNYQAAENGADESKPYHYTIYEEKNAAVFTFDSCIYDDDYKQTVFDFFSAVTEKDLDNVIIDLSRCSSGTTQVLDEMLMYIDRETFRTPGGVQRLGPYMMEWKSEDTKIIKMDVETLFSGNLYVLTSYHTFGSATMIAEILQDNGFATVVGEPCGNMPEGYGEVAAFQTPNSAVTFQVSSKIFYRIDSEKSDEPLTPDIECAKGKALITTLEMVGG